MTPRLHKSQRLSYAGASPTKASTTSGAMYSADPTLDEEGKEGENNEIGVNIFF